MHQASGICSLRYFAPSVHAPLELKKLLLINSFVIQIVMVGSTYEIWGCVLSQIEGCLFLKHAKKCSKILIANGKHDIGRCFLGHSKSTALKTPMGLLPLDLISRVGYSY